MTVCCGRAIADEDVSDGDFTGYSEEGLPEYSVLNVRFSDMNQCFSKRGVAVRAGLSALYNEKKFRNPMGFFVVPCELQNSDSEGYSTTPQANRTYRVIFPTNSKGDVTSPGPINALMEAFPDLNKYPVGSVGFIHVHGGHGFVDYDTSVMCGLSTTVFLYRSNSIIERYSPPSIDWTQTQATKACTDELRINKPVPTRLWMLNMDTSQIEPYIDTGEPLE